ncbi:hypothetical protein P886_3799 [Alteromonadaceae bacterium 2753L.S.0a.02]|nr:hypothetical protein P886_3799 [Alteromonadaceae bacterium 2753L.S.0a.02]
MSGNTNAQAIGDDERKIVTIEDARPKLNFAHVIRKLAVIEDLLQIPGELLTDDARAGARVILCEVREEIEKQK